MRTETRAPSLKSVIERLPVLPQGVIPFDLDEQLKLPRSKRTGFAHSANNEWNFLWQYKGRWYRLPESMAIALRHGTRHFDG